MVPSFPPESKLQIFKYLNAVKELKLEEEKKITFNDGHYLVYLCIIAYCKCPIHTDTWLSFLEFFSGDL